MRKATLILDDGSRFEGKSFGYEKPVAGEVVFHTAMIGYPESLTDPAFVGQIVTYTYPLIGNYGVPEFSVAADGLATYMESDRIQPAAILVTDYSEEFSHWNAKESLADWLHREQIPALTGIDTRTLAKHLREHGAMSGRIEFDAQEVPVVTEVHPVQVVSCTEVKHYGEGVKKVAVPDCGVKNSQVRALTARGVEVVRVPWNEDFNALSQVDGLFLAGGPGNPEELTETIAHIRTFMESRKPILGVGMGAALLALAAGAKVEKLKYGHHGSQSVRREGTDKCYITVQNHGYTIVPNTLPEGWQATYVNLSDGSCEGFAHESAPWTAVAFSPETVEGAHDTEFIYDDFLKLL